MLTEDDLRSPRRRRIALPLFLFLATCVSTFFVGATGWQPVEYREPPNWQQGLVYMAAVIGILLTHEMGHFLQAVRYHVPASLPYFIPLPVMMTGTMGAVIGMEGSRADRKQLFDIGISGPLAGLLVAIPVICLGVLRARPGDIQAAHYLNDPLIFRLITHWLRPDLADNVVLAKGPLLMAGWVGMLITGLNMMPISQLDGGHVVYGLFGKRAHLMARGFVCAAIAAMLYFDDYTWLLMLTLVLFIGIDHPPTRDDTVKLGPIRTTVGWLSLLIPVLCFTPVPM